MASTAKNLTKTIIPVVLVLAAINLLFLYSSPQELVELIGVENSYLVIFLIAAFGGLSSFTSGVLYGSLATFAAGGSIPWLLGISAGVGIAIGDSLLYFLFRYGLTGLGPKWQERIERYRTRVDQIRRRWQALGLYGLLGFTPIPNDLVMFALAVLGFRYRFIAPILLVSGITIATLTAYLGHWWL